MNYPGGKNASYHKIINLIPPHTAYIETHLGSGAVLRHLRSADRVIGLDIDSQVIATSRTVINGVGVQLVCVDAHIFLQMYPFQGDEFIYCDPPYVMSARRQHRQIYRYEYTPQQHIELLTLLKSLPCKVMISGYWSSLYETMLQQWHTATFEAVTRGNGMATEYLWMNYPQPAELHDYSYLGDDFRERERIRRKVNRWVKGLKRLPRLERQAIIEAIATYNDAIS